MCIVKYIQVWHMLRELSKMKIYMTDMTDMIDADDIDILN